MTGKKSAYPEVLCIRVPKGTEKRVRAARKSLKITRPAALRKAVEIGLMILESPLVQSSFLVAKEIDPGVLEQSWMWYPSDKEGKK